MHYILGHKTQLYNNFILSLQESADLLTANIVLERVTTEDKVPRGQRNGMGVKVCL